MRLRADGVETRKRILQSAGAVFADRGYRGATVAEICRRARANAASINYHFQGKQSLYVAVWRHFAEEAVRLYPMDGGVAPEAPAEERFRGLLVSLLKRMSDRGKLGTFHRLRMVEMANPTGLLHGVHRELLKPLRDYTRQIVRELLGSEPDARMLDFCEMTAIGPCLMAQLTLKHRGSAGTPAFCEADIESFADHCVRFAVGGLKALRPVNHRGNGRH